MCQLVLPAMRAAGEGTIVNLGSGAGLVAPPLSSAYSMSKYSLEPCRTRYGSRPVASACAPSSSKRRQSRRPSLTPGAPRPEQSPTALRQGHANVLGFARREGERGISQSASRRWSCAPSARLTAPSLQDRKPNRVALVTRRALGDAPGTRPWPASTSRIEPRSDRVSSGRRGGRQSGPSLERSAPARGCGGRWYPRRK